MRLRVMGQMAKGLVNEQNTTPAHMPPAEDAEEELDTVDIGKELERVKWFLWHGNVVPALDTIEDIEGELDFLPHDGESRRKLLKAVREFRGYIEANQNFIPNYGDRYRHGEKISTAFAESAVNQVVSKRMVKKQQMRWSEAGAHNCSRCGRRHSMINSGRPSFAGIRECTPNRRRKLRRRPVSPRFEMLSYYCISSCFPTHSITGHFKSTIATIADLRLIGNFCHASITRFNSVSAGGLALCESPCESRVVSS